MIELRYIGRKDWAVDPVGGSCVIWNGNGDVQPVPLKAARKILKHPDEWELANPEEAARLEVNTTHVTTDETGALTEVDDADLKKPLEKMTRAELKVYAKLTFDRDIPATMPKSNMIDTIEEFERDLNRVNTMTPDLDETPKIDAPEAPPVVEAPFVDPTISAQ
jgi:hypothetical protein